MNLLKLKAGDYNNQGVAPMKTFTPRAIIGLFALALLGAAGSSNAAVNVQCPGDTDGDAVIDTPDAAHPTAKCMHLTAGDSFVNMSDGNPMYTFGFGDRTGVAPQDVISDGILAAEWPGPTIQLEQGEEFYLSLTNVGTVIRADLFDPHTVHFHGFPNAASVFDGVPEVSISVNMGATLSYYYNIVQPGTFIYHCHVEASEHMEMGMLANLWVHAGQDQLGVLGNAGPDGRIGTGDDVIDYSTASQRIHGNAASGPLGGYVYNDGDGSTAYDVEEPIQVSSFDPDFHDASFFVQPLPFALLEAKYPMINGRGYPDTVLAGPMDAPTDNVDPVAGYDPGKMTGNPGEVLNNGAETQTEDSVISVNQGQKLLLRMSNVSIDRFYTLTAPGLTMQIVGTGAKLMRGTDGKSIYRNVSSVNFGGGETHDVIIDTSNVAPGTYFLHAAELHQMSNLTQMAGGMITEIVVN
jgi:FtsP/CotA-like multicopper oxidase with cupredoxin domain